MKAVTQAFPHFPDTEHIITPCKAWQYHTSSTPPTHMMSVEYDGKNFVYEQDVECCDSEALGVFEINPDSIELQRIKDLDSSKL